MDESLARALLSELRNLTNSLNVLSKLSEGIADDTDRKELRRSIATLMVECDHQLIRPIERRYPQLEGIAVDKS